MAAAPRPAQGPSRNGIRLFSFFAALLTVAGAFLKGPGSWGFDHWSAFPLQAFVPAAVLLGLILLPAGRRLVARLLDPLARAIETPGGGLIISIAVSFAFTAAFWLARERTFFLSDGDLLIRALNFKMKGAFAADLLSYRLEVLTFQILSRVFSVTSKEASAQLLSILSGALWMAVLFETIGRLASRGWERLLLGGLLMTLGFTRLFYGYVETSPLFAAAAAVYLWRAVIVLKTGRGLPGAFLSLLAVVLMHTTGVLLVPSFLYILMRNRPARTKAAVIVGGSVLALLGVGAILLSSHGRSKIVSDYLSNFIPVGGKLGARQADTLFSPAHWNDFFQQQFLLGPFAFLALLLLMVLDASRTRKLPWPITRRDGDEDDNRPIALFLLLQVVPFAFLSFLYGRKLGAARDWDLLAGLAPAAALLIGLMLFPALAPRGSKSRPDRRDGTLPELVVLVAAVGLFHLVPWVLVDVNVARSEERFARLVAPEANLSRFSRAYGYELLGSHYFEKNDLKTSRDWFAKAAATDSTDVKALMPLATVLLHLEETDKAIATYRALVRVQPDSAEPNFRLADALMTADRPGEAAPLYEKAIRLNPKQKGIWQNLGNAYVRTDQPARADSAYIKALAETPRSAELWFNRGFGRESAGDTAAAREYYEKALALDPNQGTALFNLGTMYLKAENPMKAIPYLKRDHDLHPSTIGTARNLAVAYAFLGRGKEAESLLSSMTTFDLELVHTCVDAANILSDLGHKDEALSILTMCRNRNPRASADVGLAERMAAIGAKK